MTKALPLTMDKLCELGQKKSFLILEGRSPFSLNVRFMLNGNCKVF